LENDNQTWKPYSDINNDIIEQAFVSSGKSCTVMNMYRVNLHKRRQKNLKTKFQRQVLRGSWFYQHESGVPYPYPEKTATDLEMAWQRLTNGGTQSMEVNVGHDRVVVVLPGQTVHKQVSRRGVIGRDVWRGWPSGSVKEEIVETTTTTTMQPQVVNVPQQVVVQPPAQVVQTPVMTSTPQMVQPQMTMQGGMMVQPQMTMQPQMQMQGGMMMQPQMTMQPQMQMQGGMMVQPQMTMQPQMQMQGGMMMQPQMTMQPQMQGGMMYATPPANY